MRIVFGGGPIKREKCGKKDQGETGSVRKLRAFSVYPIPNVGLLLRRCSGKGLHLAMTGEPRGFSRVAA